MIKQLLTIFAIGAFTFASAQKANDIKVNHSVQMPLSSKFANSNQILSAPGCVTLATFNASLNVTLYTANITTACATGGYIFGNNCYGYQEIATYIPASAYSSVSAPSVNAVSVVLYRNNGANIGTKGTGNAGMTIYNGTSAASQPGSQITTTTAPLPSIIAAQTGTSNLFIYTFTLTPSALPTSGGFFASVVLPTNTGDTVAIYTQTNSTTNYAWGKDGSGWFSATADWGITTSHAMLAVICGTDVATGISDNLGLSKEVKITPNPSTGVFNMNVNLTKAENLDVTVTNALGQVLSARRYEAILSNSITIDLTGESNGVYFVTISNGTDKMVQRLVVNK